VPFYRRRWEEARGDEHDDWGPSTWYFWVHDGVLEQQVEVYDNGVMLAYDRFHKEAQFGLLSDESLDPKECGPFEIDLEVYQAEVDGDPFNRR